MKKPRKKRSFALLLSAVIALLYTIYLVTYFAEAPSSASSTTEEIGASIATILVMPHMILCALGTIFNWVGWGSNSRGFALTGAIMYCVAAVVFLMYAAFLIPEIVLSFIGYARLGKINKYNLEVF